MKYKLKLEEMLLTIAAVYALFFYGAAWWWYVILFLGPDISMIGYLVNPKLGSQLYNIFHHRGLAVFLFAIGIFGGGVVFQMLAIVVFGHSSFDRMFGYGLKYPDAFKHTHLDDIK